MKKCPQCNRTYSDDTLSFCLEDGALLSASYHPQETAAPTFQLNAVEIPTVVAQEIPTVVAQEIPTVVSSSRPTEQTKSAGVGWKIYLLGLFISFIVDYVYVYFLYPLYASATLDIYDGIADKFDDSTVGYTAASFILLTPLNLIVYSLLAFVLGFIWSRGKWKWGIIALIPNIAFTSYYVVKNLSEGHASPLYYIRIFFSNILYITAACLFAYIGSRLSSRRNSH